MKQIWHYTKIIIIVITAATHLTGSANAQTTSAGTKITGPLTTVATPSYRIQPDDALDISLVGESDMMRSVVVLPDGTITYPYLGTFKVSGLTVAEVNQRITARLAKQFVNPNVTVSVSKRQENYASVLGSVKTPGKVILKDGWRVLEVLAASGGLTVERNDWATATLVRNGGLEAIPINLGALLNKADSSQNFPVNSGDILLVNALQLTQTHAQILGEVTRPGSYPIPSDGSIVTMVALAGGVTPQAALTRAIIRREGKEIPVDLLPIIRKGREGVTETASTNSTSSPRLQPGDTLVIPDNVTRFAVLGAVTKPGAILYPEDKSINVLEALSMAGGQSSDADMRKVYLIRYSPNEVNNGKSVKPIKLDLSADALRESNSKKNKEQNSKQTPLRITMSPGDVLVIGSKNPRNTTWQDLALASQLFVNLRRF